MWISFYLEQVVCNSLNNDMFIRIKLFLKVNELSLKFSVKFFKHYILLLISKIISLGLHIGDSITFASNASAFLKFKFQQVSHDWKS